MDADCSTVCATIDSECGLQGCCQLSRRGRHNISILRVLRCVEGAWPNTAQEWDSVASSAEGQALKGRNDYGSFSVVWISPFDPFYRSLMIFAYLCFVAVRLKVGRCCGTSCTLAGLLCLASVPGGWIHNPSICTDDGPAPGESWQHMAAPMVTRCYLDPTVHLDVSQSFLHPPP